MRDVMAAEWWKLRTAAWAVYIAIRLTVGVLVPVALAWDAVSIWEHAGPSLRPHLLVTPLWVVGGLIFDLVVAVLGVLTVTREYASGMIRVTLTVLPNRRQVLMAKTLVVAVIGLLTGEAGIFLGYGMTEWIVAGRPVRYLGVPLVHEIPVLRSLGPIPFI